MAYNLTQPDTTASQSSTEPDINSFDSGSFNTIYSGTTELGSLIASQYASLSNGGTFTGVISASTLSAGTLSLGGVALTSISSILGYKRYCAVVTQSSTSAPVATVLYNDLGLVPTWARTSAGFYTLSATSAVFTSNKTAAPIPVLTDFVALTQTNLTVASTSVINLKQWNITNLLSIVGLDGLTAFHVEIRIYN